MTTRWKVVTIKQGPDGAKTLTGSACYYSDYVAVVDEATGDVICDNASHYAQEVDPKHMPLIASAPELLEALKSLMEALTDLPECPHYIWPHEFAKADAAIAKATGQEPT